ncbi:hypothetical protein CRUP_007240 [Coryphaenoides rupestris]|nr:hypothetical protein CRUP_007240 [Coryphaenoides rupestris]
MSSSSRSPLDVSSTEECTLVISPSQLVNLTVTFYRGGATLGEVQSCRNSTKNSTKSPVSKTFTVSINSSREDDGVQYWCEAQLDLGPQGPQPPPVMRSPKLNTTVYYGPHSLCPKKLHLREGEALSWEARGNPQPLVTWLKDGKVVAAPTHPSREHAGNYTVSAKGALGWLNCTLNLDFLKAKGISNAYCGLFSLSVLLPSIQFIYWASNHSI